LKSQKIEISCIDAAQTGDIRGNQIEDSTDATNNSSKVTDNQRISL
jgi:hypothetical protein